MPRQAAAVSAGVAAPADNEFVSAELDAVAVALVRAAADDLHAVVEVVGTAAAVAVVGILVGATADSAAVNAGAVDNVYVVVAEGAWVAWREDPSSQPWALYKSIPPPSSAGESGWSDGLGPYVPQSPGQTHHAKRPLPVDHSFRVSSQQKRRASSPTEDPFLSFVHQCPLSKLHPSQTTCAAAWHSVVRHRGLCWHR